MTQRIRIFRALVAGWYVEERQTIPTPDQPRIVRAETVRLRWRPTHNAARRLADRL